MAQYTSELKRSRTALKGTICLNNSGFQSLFGNHIYNSELEEDRTAPRKDEPL